MKLTNKEIKTICELLGQLAVLKAEKGNSKAEKRIFKLVNKIEQIGVN